MMSDRVTIGSVRDRLVASGIAVEAVGSAEGLVSSIAHDSRAVEAGSVFVCLRGESFDGHEFAQQAVASGAVGVLVDHRLDLHPRPDSSGEPVAQLIVDDTRRAAGPAASVAWGDPSRRLATVGITGTNGKTTTAQIVAALLDNTLSGTGSTGVSPTGIIGTLHGPRTTPEGPDLHATLADFVGDGRTAAVMEVSSHALELHRIDGTAFDVVAFTNLGHDHLDLHGTHEAYFRAKSALFTSEFAPVAVLDVDDTHGRLLADTISARSSGDAMRVVEVSIGDVDDLVVDTSQHSYTWRGRRIVVPLGGDFNASNSLLALSIVAELADSLGFDLDAAISGFESLGPVPGRFESIDTPETAARDITVIVDYAHTPDGLETLLHAARPLTRGRLISVFGCAGRRDVAKRPVMGEVAARLSDVTIATSDNPRGEDPSKIIDDVICGVDEQYRRRVSSEPDRRAAIAHALAQAETGDVVVVAGKGHERTQDLGDAVIEFDDRDVVRELLRVHAS